MSSRSSLGHAANTNTVPKEDDAPTIPAAEPPLRSPNQTVSPDTRISPVDADGDQCLVPSATTSATKVVGEIAEGVKSAVAEAVKWVEKKADDLSKETDGGVGPYASPATCIPSDLDPLASGLMPAMEAEASKELHASEVSTVPKEPEKEPGGKKK